MAVQVEHRAPSEFDDLPRRVQMSREEYYELPDDDIRAEWVDGWTTFMSVPLWSHNRILRRLTVILDRELSSADVLPVSGLRTENSNRIPDIMVFATEPTGDQRWADIPPIVAVEILSPSNWRTDLVEKADEYGAHGVAQYWLVDPETRTILVRSNDKGTWRPLASLDTENPAIEVTVAGLGAVSLTQDDIFGAATP